MRPCFPSLFRYDPNANTTVDTGTPTRLSPTFPFALYVFYYVPPSIMFFFFPRVLLLLQVHSAFLFRPFLLLWPASALKNRLSFHRVYPMKPGHRRVLDGLFSAVSVRIPGEIPFRFIPRILTLIKSMSDSKPFLNFTDLIS